MVSLAIGPLALVVGTTSPMIKSLALAATMTSLMTGRPTSFVRMAAFATGHQLLERQAGPSTGDLATKWVKGSHGVLL